MCIYISYLYYSPTSLYLFYLTTINHYTVIKKKINANVMDDLIAIFTDFRSQRRLHEGKKYWVKCCAGIAIDLLNAVARDLHFDYDLYLVADGLFGVRKDGKWDGVTADLINGLAHLSFTAFSTTSSRVQVSSLFYYFFQNNIKKIL